MELIVSQTTRIDRAHGRARDILKYSSLITDAYFHYTPSQIMFAALSMADKGLADRLVNNAFHPRGDENGGSIEKPADGTPLSAVKESVLRAIESCQHMLATEPPERMTDYWGSVRSPRFRLTRPLNTHR